ncbi:Protein of uncharacterised function (DUF3114) [Streptococcus criceti]|uniref:Uncharacterized protein n=1 Tax=Streptococcus criceti HS-6 TaxID=873449 RepID=G5JN92_STRCG|nr:DUF3114 domain-containing protein [Streptococcus criceti]EHI75015.1 hypothetical protein STRCR_0129 [Streptococcus criceti HS-6]SUN41642.1 Protein of uncharacterised function (DUF3114) [Streptococcus criceti]
MILQQKTIGNFISKLDTENRTDNDVINGSSFNYADSGNDAQHNRLDRDSVTSWDPEFRKNMSDDYEKPNLSDDPDETYKSGEKAKEHDERADKHDQCNGTSKYADSWANEDGRFAQDGKSVKEATQGAGKAFEEDVKEAKS